MRDLWIFQDLSGLNEDRQLQLKCGERFHAKRQKSKDHWVLMFGSHQQNWECHEIKCSKVLPYTHQTTSVWFHNSFMYLFLALRTHHRISSHSEAWWTNPDHMAPSTVDCWTPCNQMSMCELDVAVLAIVFRCFCQRHSHSFKTNKQTKQIINPPTASKQIMPTRGGVPRSGAP